MDNNGSKGSLCRRLIPNGSAGLRCGRCPDRSKVAEIWGKIRIDLIRSSVSIESVEASTRGTEDSGWSGVLEDLEALALDSRTLTLGTPINNECKVFSLLRQRDSTSISVIADPCSKQRESGVDI